MYTNVSVHARALVFAFARFRYCETNYVHGYVDLLSYTPVCVLLRLQTSVDRNMTFFKVSCLFGGNLWTRVDVLTISLISLTSIFNF